MNIFILLQPAAPLLSFPSFFLCLVPPLVGSLPVIQGGGWGGGSLERQRLRETSAKVSVRSIRRPGEDPGPCSLRKAWGERRNQISSVPVRLSKACTTGPVLLEQEHISEFKIKNLPSETEGFGGEGKRREKQLLIHLRQDICQRLY